MSTSNTRTQLAITGRQEFWPDRGAFWLVSPACVPAPSPLSGLAERRLSGAVVYPWRPEQLPAVHAGLAQTHARVLAFLTERLNGIHGVDRPERYWRLVIGPWLFGYVNLLAHHLESLRKAERDLGPLVTIGLDPAFHSTPRTTASFLFDVSDDLFNLQLYTRVATAAGIPIQELRAPTETTRLAEMENPEALPEQPRPLFRRLGTMARYELHGRMQRIVAPAAPVILRRAYFPERFEYRLAALSRGRIWPFLGFPFDPPSVPPSAEMRSALAGFTGETEEEQVLGVLLPDDVPLVHLEEYENLVEFAERQYRGLEPRVVMSTISWHADEAFAHFAATSAERGALLVGGQHGAVHGIEASSQVEAFERSLVDRYVTWGWEDPQDPRCVPTPAVRLVEVTRRTAAEVGEGILHTCTAALRFPSVIRPDFSGYPDIQRRYFQALPPAVLAAVRVRLHASDFGWGIERRLREAVPEVRIERWDTPFSASLRRSLLYVTDHISTTLTEALATDTPTVLFWDPIYMAIRGSAQPLFDRARAVGIVHDTPESAAAWVGRIYPGDVHAWWRSAECQTVADELRERFARTSPRPLREWRGILFGLATSPSPEPAVPEEMAMATPINRGA